jgi:pimeloyl-ACP methyl ester carboxylesterase
VARNRFASIEKIGRVSIPKLFIHSREDEVNPFHHSVRLHEAAPAPKQLVEVSGGHATAYKLDPRFMAGMAGFLAELGFPAPPLDS